MKRVLNPNLSKPWDNHCSNCSWWSKLNQWCNCTDGPLADLEARNNWCQNWKWVVPKYLYVYEKEAGSEKGD
jgi:hypothetical protein